MPKIHSIGFKLFLALTLTALGAVLALAIMFWLSLGAGFNDYIARLELSRLDKTDAFLVAKYQEHNDWRFAVSPRDISPSNLIAPPKKIPANQHQPELERASTPPHNLPPHNLPPHANGPGPQSRDLLAFGERLALFNAQGELIMGRPEAKNQPRREVNDAKGITIGYLALAPMPAALGNNEQKFISSQAHNMLLSCLFAIVISAIAALVLARYFRKPIAALAEGAKQLANGQLQTRVLLKQHDELGELALDFNVMAQKLESFEQARRQWIADTSHELRTPLTILRAHTEAMRDGVMPLDQRGLARINSAVVDLERLVTDLYQLARSDIGMHNYVFETIKLEELFSELREKFSLPMQKSGLSLSIPTTNIMLNGDYGRLIQLFSNLLTNSISYTTSGGSMAIQAKRYDNKVEISLDDSAPGVPDSTLPHLFERFYRVDDASIQQAGRSGLGLSICKAIVTGHGGTIVAEASHLGGLRIKITLPLTEVKT